MSQAIFKNPYVSVLPGLAGVGNGTLTIDRLTHYTVGQQYQAICTGIAPFTVFNIVGSLDGPVGVAVVATQFSDPDLKVFLTINQGPVPFEVGDTFTFTVAAGTDVTEENFNTYDENPQKNFGPGVLGQHKGDENIRLTPGAMLAHILLQDIIYTSQLAGEQGDSVYIEYYNTTALQKAALTIQDIRFEADAAGSAGNAITIEYQDHFAGTAATAYKQAAIYYAKTVGTAGNAITIEYTAGGTAGSETVGVLGSAITVQIASGVSTIAQIRTAIRNYPAADALVGLYFTGTGLETQVDEAATPLIGGLDPIGLAGSEVVTVAVNAIHVRLQSGVSTATQVKVAIDASVPAAALVNVTITGTAGNAQAAPVAPTNLTGGTDSIGGPGNEVVTVTGRHIRVGFQSGVNTAADIMAAVNGTPAAAALVVASIGGTAGDAQTAPTVRYLRGGHDTNCFALNKDELTAPADFFEGNAELLLYKLITQGGLYCVGAAEYKNLLSLDDLFAGANGSGPAVANAQQLLNKLVQNTNVHIGTEDNSKVRWNAPGLYFTAPLVIRFADTGVTNRILHTTYSPINLADGESLSVVVNRTASANLVPTVAIGIAVGHDVLRIATRHGGYIQFWDGTILGENQVARIGAAIDLWAQQYVLATCAGKLHYNPAVLGEISWDAPILFKPLGSAAVVQVYADTVTLPDDYVAYIQLDDPIVTATKVLQLAPRSDVLMGRPDIYWFMFRSGNTIYVRNHGEMEPGEDGSLGDAISDDIFTYMGSTGETDATPDYSHAVTPLGTANHYVADDDNLTKAIKKLDTALDAEAYTRGQADIAINGRIDDEIQDRQDADGLLDGRIDDEIQDRQDADSLLQDAIDDLYASMGTLQLVEHPTDKKRVVLTGVAATLVGNKNISHELQRKLIAFDGAEIDFSTGAIYKADGITVLGNSFTLATIGAGLFHWYAVAVVADVTNADNTLALKLIVTSATGDGTPANLAPRADFTGTGKTKRIGQVVVQESAGSIANILQAAIVQVPPQTASLEIDDTRYDTDNVVSGYKTKKTAITYAIVLGG